MLYVVFETSILQGMCLRKSSALPANLCVSRNLRSNCTALKNQMFCCYHSKRIYCKLNWRTLNRTYCVENVFKLTPSSCGVMEFTCILCYILNLLTPTGHVMHQQFNIQQFTFFPTHCIYVFCIYLRTNSDLCHLQHKLIGFYNRDENCLLRGTNLIFK
jgi:hypothetical protein